MLMQWKTFPIDLDSLNSFLKISIPHADGIVASVEAFEIIEKTPFVQADIDAINNYYNALTKDGEQVKIDAVNFPTPQPLPSYDNNDAAVADGLPVGALYQQSGVVYTVC